MSNAAVDYDYARTWAEHDPDPDTARQVKAWIEEGNTPPPSPAPWPLAPRACAPPWARVSPA